MRAAKQYGVSERILDLCTFDVTKNPWRCGELFDAIITDPPCMFLCHLLPLTPTNRLTADGVRAGAKRLGRKPRPPGAPRRPAVAPPSQPRP